MSKMAEETTPPLKTLIIFRTCSVCKDVGALEAFTKQSGGKYGRRSICKTCSLDYQWKRDNPGHTEKGFIRWKKLKNQYDRDKPLRTKREKDKAAETTKQKPLLRIMSRLARELRFDALTCGNCGKKRSELHIHLDHCHLTNKFRGFLCANCNQGYGKLGDSIENVEAWTTRQKTLELDVKVRVVIRRLEQSLSK